MVDEELDMAEAQIMDIITFLNLQHEKTISPWIRRLQELRDLRPKSIKIEAEQYVQLVKMGFIK